MSRSILQYFYEQDDTETDSTDEPQPQAPPEKKSNWLVDAAKKYLTPAKDLNTIVKKRQSALDDAGNISGPPKQG